MTPEDDQDPAELREALRKVRAENARLRKENAKVRGELAEAREYTRNLQFALGIRVDA